MRAELQTLHAAIASVGNARQRWTSRASVRLILDDGAGHVGLGEAAPLPGLSKETALDARAALDAVDWPSTLPRSIDEVRSIVDTIDAAVPSARFAAETALLSMLAAKQERPLWSLWWNAEGEPDPVPVATAIWGEDVDDVAESVAEAASYDAPAIKLKVGRGPLDRVLLDVVRARMPDVELRLDANGAIPKAQLPTRLDQLAAYEPRFIEEPSEIEATLALAETPIPLAIDESLAAGWSDRALAHEAVHALVLKPSLLGGLLPCRDLAEQASARGKIAIVSHLFESTIARAACAHLALALGTQEATGLGEHPALAPLSDGLTASWIDFAWIEVPDLPGLGLELAW